MLEMITAGESHGPALVGILQGLPAGLEIRPEEIERELRRRWKGEGASRRQKIEKDKVQILSGWVGGKTTGSPLCLAITNADHANWQGKKIKPQVVPRPGHSDLIGALKYGYSDLRLPAERASARETAMRTALGAVCKKLLQELHIWIGGWVLQLGQVHLPPVEENFQKAWQNSEANSVRCPLPEKVSLFQEEIEKARREGDTLGGTVQVVATGLPPALGSYQTSSQRLDGRLGGALLSIPSVKGVAIGPAFENATLRGSQVHGSIERKGEKLHFRRSRSGGLVAGMTTGEPLWLLVAFKPISTLAQGLPSVDLTTGEAAKAPYVRSDVCAVPRAVPIVEAVLAFVLAQAVLERTGGDTMEQVQQRFSQLPTLEKGAFSISPKPWELWP